MAKPEVAQQQRVVLGEWTCSGTTAPSNQTNLERDAEDGPGKVTADQVMRRRYEALDEADKMQNDVALVEAAQHGDLSKVRLLLEEAGADVNATCQGGSSPLWRAASRGHLDVVKYLVLKAAADVNAMSTGRWTPLYVADYRGHTQVAAFLRAHGGEM